MPICRLFLISVGAYFPYFSGQFPRSNLQFFVSGILMCFKAAILSFGVTYSFSFLTNCLLKSEKLISTEWKQSLEIKKLEHSHYQRYSSPHSDPWTFIIFCANLQIIICPPDPPSLDLRSGTPPSSCMSSLIYQKCHPHLHHIINIIIITFNFMYQNKEKQPV